MSQLIASSVQRTNRRSQVASDLDFVKFFADQIDKQCKKAGALARPGLFLSLT